MKKLRNSVSNFQDKKVQFINKDFHRANSRQIVLSKAGLQPKNNFTRQRSSLITLEKVEERERKKILQEKVLSKFKQFERKITYKNNFGYQIMKSIIIEPKMSNKKMLKRNSFYKRKIGTKHFYKIRKKINQIFINKYKSPYMDYLIKKGYYIHYKKSDYPKYYNFYMINNLMNNKRCHLTITYSDNLYIYNSQEYLIRYFGKNEIFIIMNYALFFIYDKDIHSIAKYKKKIVKNEDILNMFNNLVKSNYYFFGTMEIFKDIAVYYRNSKVNNSKLSILNNLDNVKPILDEEIHYIYAKDVPPQKFPNSLPNFFCLGDIILSYFKKYLAKEKFSKLKTNVIDKNQNKNIVKKNKNRFEEEKISYNKNTKTTNNNILLNLSLSLSKEKNLNDEQSESEESKIMHNSNRRLKIDNDIYDVEILVDKILNRYYSNKEKGNNPINKLKSQIIQLNDKKPIYKRRATKFRTTQISNLLNYEEKNISYLKQNPINNKLIEINNNSGVFKTSVKYQGLFNKIALTPKENILTSSFNNSGRRVLGENINLFISKKKEERDFPSPHTQLNILKYTKKVLDNDNKKFMNFKNIINKDNKSNFALENKVISKTKLRSKNLFKRSNSYYNDKNSNSTIKEVSSNCSTQNLIFYKFKETEKFLSNSTKNKYNVNKYISLKKINKLPKFNYNPQKTKVYFKSPNQNAFCIYSGMTFDKKVVNIWESKKIEGVTVKETYITNNLFTKIKNFNIKNHNDFQRSSTFNEIIKSPNIYISNLG